MKRRPPSKNTWKKSINIAGLALKCEVCGRLFGQKNKFEGHKLLCGNQVRPFTCSEPGCPKAYRTKWMFDNHMGTVHTAVDQDPVTFTCEYCAKNLGSKQALDTHRKQKHFKKVGQMNIESNSNQPQLYWV